MKEDSLLSFFARKFSYPGNASIVVGPGDDCAVLDTGGREYMLVTVDEVQDGTHFLMNFTRPQLLAAKLVRMNVSDIYSMGDARPLFCVIAGGLSRSTQESWVRRFSSALKKEADFFGMKVIGGNLCRSEKIHFSMTVIGSVPRNRLVLRKGASAGELVVCAGRLGEARAGLEILMAGRAVKGLEKKLVSFFWKPEIRFRDSAHIAPFATSMLDNSDGLYRSLKIIASENRLKVKAFLTPDSVSPELKAWCYAGKKDWRRYAIEGGEDYGLIFTLKEKDFPALKRKMPHLRIIGRLEKGSGVEIEGYEEKVETFQHF